MVVVVLVSFCGHIGGDGIVMVVVQLRYSCCCWSNRRWYRCGGSIDSAVDIGGAGGISFDGPIGCAN